MPSAPLIAIVEDDAPFREALTDLIEVFDFEGCAFESSERFLAAHAPGRFDCLITDLNLPGESGLHLRQRLQVLDPSLPVIIISAQADTGARAAALRSGALAYLVKPISDQVLLQHLGLALGLAPSDG